MSVESITYERITILNQNEKTAEIVKSIYDYLNEVCVIRSLRVKFDSIEYDLIEDCGISFDKSDTENNLCDVLKGMFEAENLEIEISSEAFGNTIDYRKENSFVGMFTDDADVKENVTYKCIEYYDTDCEVCIAVFDKDGFRWIDDYTDDASIAEDIENWYNYTNEFSLTFPDERNEINKDFYINTLQKIALLCIHDEESLENAIEDEFDDYGEVYFSHSLSFSSKSIPLLISLHQMLADKAEEDSVKFYASIYAVSNGIDDYPFCSLLISQDEMANSVQPTVVFKPIE